MGLKLCMKTFTNSLCEVWLDLKLATSNIPIHLTPTSFVALQKEVEPSGV